MYFRVWSTILEQQRPPAPQIPLAKSIIKPQGQNASFSPSGILFFGGGEGVNKLSSMVAALKRIEWSSNPPPLHSPENEDKVCESQNIGGDKGGRLMKNLSILSKNSSSQGWKWERAFYVGSPH